MSEDRGMTDNSKLSAEDRQKLFAHHFREELAVENQMRELKARKSANRKLAKSYDPTFTSQKLDHYLKAHFAEDQQKPVDRLKSDRENLAWLGLIPSTDGKDLLAQVDRVDSEGMIRAKGYEAGMLGLERVSGYDAGSVDDKMWLESYDAGREEYDSDIPDILARIGQAKSNEEPEASGDDPFPAAEAAE